LVGSFHHGIGFIVSCAAVIASIPPMSTAEAACQMDKFAVRRIAIRRARKDRTIMKREHTRTPAYSAVGPGVLIPLRRAFQPRRIGPRVEHRALAVHLVSENRDTIFAHVWNANDA